ncbi:hypothetical protein B566_EDAN009173 [Ephemera danica]|nr:hypothetical protein B566_EDAN009173 [Ephemera danica]
MSPTFIVLGARGGHESETDEHEQLHVPNNEKQRKLWFAACRRDVMSMSGTKFVCEDHFELRDDLDNYWQYTLQPGTKARFKRHVVPHIFHCQNRNIYTNARVASERRREKHLIDNLLMGLPLIQHAIEEDTILQTNQPGIVQAPSGQDNELIGAPKLDTDAEELGDAAQNENLTVDVVTNPKTSTGTQCCIETVHAECQVNIRKNVRSKSVQVKPKEKDSSCSPLKKDVRSVALSPMKGTKVKYQDIYTSSSESSVESEPTDYTSDCEEEWTIDSDESVHSVISNEILVFTRQLNFKDPMFYMGVPTKCVWIVDFLAEEINYSVESVYINLPFSFWARYKNVYVVIDTFEIECEHPEKAYDQAGSWSDYKGCNTFKFLVGMSPEGARGCKLLRPPSTEGNSQLSKEDAVAGRVIASLRIHVERLIRRLREFKMLKPHAVVSHCFSNLFGLCHRRSRVSALTSKTLQKYMLCRNCDVLPSKEMQKHVYKTLYERTSVVGIEVIFIAIRNQSSSLVKSNQSKLAVVRWIAMVAAGIDAMRIGTMTSVSTRITPMSSRVHSMTSRDASVVSTAMFNHGIVGSDCLHHRLHHREHHQGTRLDGHQDNHLDGRQGNQAAGRVVHHREVLAEQRRNLDSCVPRGTASHLQ